MNFGYVRLTAFFIFILHQQFNRKIFDKSRWTRVRIARSSLIFNGWYLTYLQEILENLLTAWLQTYFKRLLKRFENPLLIRFTKMNNKSSKTGKSEAEKNVQVFVRVRWVFQKF